jgi:hypothetical protein
MTKSSSSRSKLEINYQFTATHNQIFKKIGSTEKHQKLLKTKKPKKL